MNVTVCIPTIPSRRSLLSRLLYQIDQQAGASVEVLIADGDLPMGDKLNRCFAAARGLYVVAVDDDDQLAGNWYLSILDTIHHVAPVDFIGHDILWTEQGAFQGIVRHSLDGDPDWFGLHRGVSPKCPVRTELARSVRFGNEYTADRAWSKAVHRAATTGAYIPAALYHYDHWDAHMVGTEPGDPRYRNPQRHVGTWPFNPARFTWLAA